MKAFTTTNQNAANFFEPTVAPATPAAAPKKIEVEPAADTSALSVVDDDEF